MCEQILISALKKSKCTIICGNIGRRPNIVMYYMKKYFNDWKVKYKPFDNDRIEFVNDDYDVLIWFEPPFKSVIETSQKCIIVFTSHLDLKHNASVIHYHLGIRDNSIYDKFDYLKDESVINYFENIVEPNIQLKTNHDNSIYNGKFQDILIIPSEFRFQNFIEIYKPSIVSIYLGNCTNAHMVYLCLLNAMDNIRYYSDFVITWKIILQNPNKILF